MLQKAIDESQKYVTGEITLKLYKGNILISNRSSIHSLYDTDLVSFEDSDTDYDQSDAGGFIKINALRLRLLAKRNKKNS
jgi:argininosuccinate synthase